jgi:hypothetical protein
MKFLINLLIIAGACVIANGQSVFLPNNAPFVPPMVASPRYFSLFGGFLPGKRSVDHIPQFWNGQNKTQCVYVQESSLIRCDSGEQKFDCDVEARLNAVNNITVRLPWLNMVPEVVKQSGSDVRVIRLFSRVHLTSTMINPKTNKDITLSIYSSPVVQEPGWFVKDAKCFEKIDSVVSALGVEGVKFAVDIERS